jgi:hypothetical protein
MMIRRLDGALLAWLSLPRLVALALPMAALCAAAQTIDDVAVVTQGADVVARVRMNAVVRYLRQAPVASTQLLRIDFELVTAEENVRNQSAEESRKVSGLGNAPDMTLTYVGSPRNRLKQLTLEFARPTLVKARQGANSRTLELVFAGAASAQSIAPASDRRWAVKLQTVPLNAQESMLPVPMQFQAYDVFSVNTVVAGVPSIEINLGYFESEEQAQGVRAQAAARFPGAVVVDLAKRRSEVLQETAALPQTATAATTAPAATAPAAAPATQPSAPSAQEPPRRAVAVEAAASAAGDAKSNVPVSEVDRRGAELLEKSRQALTARNYALSIDLLNQLLLLPPNPASKEAQELIGLAWERSGNVARARTEYQLYLRLFPGGEGAERVAQRMASLEGTPTPAAGETRPTTASATPPVPAKTYSGSIAQYYYGGVARSQSLVTVVSGVDQQTLTRTTQSALITSADLSARYVKPDYETRVVVRGTGATNLSSESQNSSLLNSAYVDYRRTESGLAMRLGRQSAISGGLLGLFDGVSTTYPIRTGLKVSLMGGVPANTLVAAPSQRLLAALVEADSILDNWGGNLYILDQTVEGFTNRRALGAEIRYAADTFSAYSLLDYDINFKQLNAVTLQGSLQAPGQTTVTVLVDNRKAPSLQLSNALISTGQTSLKDYLTGHSLEEARAAALGITANARQGLISVARPINERWQMGLDLRYSQIGALPAVGVYQATPATGAQISASAQFTGSNLYSSRDISAIGASVIRSPLFDGAQISYNNLTGIRDGDITIEPSIRFYGQRSNDGLKLYRVTPGLRASYRASPQASIIGESIVEYSTTDSASGSDKTRSVFFYVGYRYDFN